MVADEYVYLPRPWIRDYHSLCFHKADAYDAVLDAVDAGCW